MMRYGRTVVAETELPELDLLIREFETNGNVNNSIDYMHRLQDLLRVSWTEFNDNFMRIGFLSLVDAVLAIYDALYTGYISISSLIFRSGLFFVQCSAFIIGEEEHLIIILGASLSFSLIIRVIRTVSTLFSFTSSMWDIFMFCLITAHALSFFSNSYIVFESSAIRFLTQTAVAVAFWQSFSYRPRSHRQRPTKSFSKILKSRYGLHRFAAFVGIIICLRLGVYFEKCREEQQSACEATIFSVPISRLPYGELKMARFLFGIFVVGGALHYGAKSLNSHPSEVWNSSLLFPAPLTIVLHWMTYWLSEEMAARNPQFPLLTAQIVYGLSTLSIILLACRITVGENITNMYGCSLSYLFSIAASLILILGDGLVFSFVTLIVIMFLIRHVTEDEHYQLTIIVLLMSHGFFALSHQPVFSSIPWQAAFIGIPGNFSWQALPATLVIMHIFAAHIIVCAALPMFMTQQLEHHYGLAHWSYKLLFFYSLKALSVCGMAAIHRRHLMVWKIFAPKFVFESISVCIVCITVFITNCIFRKLLVSSSQYVFDKTNPPSQ